MSNVAAVARQVTAKPGSGTVKAGAKADGAGASTGADGLDGAFAAIMAATSDVKPAGKAAQPVAPGAVLQLAVQAKPDIVAGATTKPVETAADGEAEGAADADADIDTDGDAAAAKLRKAGKQAKASDGTADPALLQLAGTSAAPTAPLPLDLPTAKKTKTVAAIDGDASSGTKANGAPVVSLAPKQPDEAKADKPAATPAVAAAAVPAAAKPAEKNGAATTATPVAAASTQTADSRTDSNANGSSGEDKDGSAAAAQGAGAVADSSTLAAVPADPFEEILRSLPPVVQSQLQPVADVGGAAPVASAGDMLGNQVIDMGVSGQWIDRMAREIASLADGTGHSRFQLMPPSLGRIQVDLWQGDDKTNVRLLTETDEAARRLRDGQGALEANARLASVSLGTVSVEKSASSFDSSRDQGSGQQQRQQADMGGNAQQQASNGAGAQAQGQSGQGGRNSGANAGAFSAVMGSEPQAEAQQVARAPRGDDPRVRFA